MRKNSNARILPLVIVPAVIPAIMFPVMSGHRVPDGLIGAAFGFFIGLAVIALAFMAARSKRRAPPNL